MKRAKEWNVGLITITAEQIEIAKSNGLTRGIVYSRISEEMEWPVHDAITTPVQKRAKKRCTKADIQEAAANGICNSTFMTRLYDRDWPLERAKTEKPKVRKRGR